MHPTLLSLPLLFTVVNIHIFTVHCRLRPSVEDIASNYIVSRLSASHPILASKLLNVLLKSVEQNYIQTQTELQEESPKYREEIEEDEDDELEIPEDRINERRNVLSSDEDVSEAGIRNSFSDSIDGIVRRAGRPQRQQFQLGRRLRRLPEKKRSLGQCIHKCLNGSGNMNFIQCKSMCH